MKHQTNNSYVIDARQVDWLRLVSLRASEHHNVLVSNIDQAEATQAYDIFLANGYEAENVAYSDATKTLDVSYP